MVFETPFLCHIACISKTYQILSSLLFQQSLYFFLSVHRIFIYLSLSLYYMLCSIFQSISYSIYNSGALLRENNDDEGTGPGMNERAPPHASALARKSMQLSARRHAMKMHDNSAVHQEDSFRPLCSKKTASRPKPSLED